MEHYGTVASDLGIRVRRHLRSVPDNDDERLVDLLAGMYPMWDVTRDGCALRATRRRPCNCPPVVEADTAQDLAANLGRLDVTCKDWL